MAKAAVPEPEFRPSVASFRDFPGEVEESAPVQVAVAVVTEPDPEPAKPATKKEN